MEDLGPLSGYSRPDFDIGATSSSHHPLAFMKVLPDLKSYLLGSLEGQGGGADLWSSFFLSSLPGTPTVPEVSGVPDGTVDAAVHCPVRFAVGILGVHKVVWVALQRLVVKGVDLLAYSMIGWSSLPLRKECSTSISKTVDLARGMGF